MYLQIYARVESRNVRCGVALNTHRHARASDQSQSTRTVARDEIDRRYTLKTQTHAHGRNMGDIMVNTTALNTAARIYAASARLSRMTPTKAPTR